VQGTTFAAALYGRPIKCLLNRGGPSGGDPLSHANALTGARNANGFVRTSCGCPHLCSISDAGDKSSRDRVC
jgi:hypothetical protein